MAECTCAPIEVTVPDPIIIEVSEYGTPAPGSVTADMLADGSVTPDKLSPLVYQLALVADGTDQRLAIVYEEE